MMQNVLKKAKGLNMVSKEEVIAQNVYLYSYANQYDIKVFKGDVYERDGKFIFKRDIARDDRQCVVVDRFPEHIRNNMFWMKKKDHKKARAIFEKKADQMIAKSNEYLKLYGRMREASKQKPQEIW